MSRVRSFLARGNRRFGILRTQGVVEGVKLIGPEAFIEAQPSVCRRKRRRLEPAEMRPAFDPAAKKSGALEHFDVLGRGGERHPKRRGQFADALLALREAA